MMSVGEVLRKAGIVSDVIDQPPDLQIQVCYGSLEVDPGTTLTPTQVCKKPDAVKISSSAVKEGLFYSLLMTDPDAPSRSDPKWGEWRHWLVINIPGAEFAAGHTSSGEEVVEYIGSGPPKGTGHHRYVFLAFEQQGRIQYTDPKLGVTGTNRACTKTRELIAKYKLGSPMAANYFLAEHDEYVPLLYKKMAENEKKEKSC